MKRPFVLVVVAVLAAAPAARADTPPDLADYKSCGLTSFFVVCRAHGVVQTWDEARAKLGPSAEGGEHTFAELERAFQRAGLKTLAVKVTPEQVRSLPWPAVVHTRYGRGRPEPHFIAAVGAGDDGIQLIDPPYPPAVVLWPAFEAADLTPDVSRVLFAIGRRSDLLGRTRDVHLNTRRPAAALKVVGCPDWLEARFVPAEEGRVTLRLTVLRPPPAVASPTTLRVSADGQSDDRGRIEVAVHAAD